MSRTFNSATPDFFNTATAIPAGVPYPCTLAGWFKSGTATNMSILSIQQAVSTGYLSLRVDGSHVIAEYFDGTVDAIATTAATYTSNTWTHAAGTFAVASASRTAYLNGGNAVTDSTSASNITLTSTSIGEIRRSTPAYPFNGSLAECGIWNIILSANDIAALGAGMSPLLVRPDALVGYWPLWGNDSPEPDWNPNGSMHSMTLSGGPTAGTSNPPIVMPSMAGFKHGWKGLP